MDVNNRFNFFKAIDTILTLAKFRYGFFFV